MLVNQQLSTGQTSGQVRFVPVASSVSGIGSTVTYGVNSPSISAYNTSNAFQSGVYTPGVYSIPQTTFATPVSYYPTISAGQFGQVTSGSFIGWPTRGMVQPSVDISETSSDVIVSAYVSNVNMNDLRLNVTENSITISASAWTGNEHLVLNRTVALPTSIRAEAVDASLQSGVLEIRLPKTERFNRTRTTLSPETTQA